MPSLASALRNDAERAVFERARAEAAADPLIPPPRLYVGRGSDVVMAPFRYRSASRFSSGAYGVLYVGDTTQTVQAEWAYHRATFLRASDPPMPAGTSTAIFVHDLHLSTRTAVDVRGDTSGLLLPDEGSYPTAQTFAAAQRAAGADGILYTSVRLHGAECFAAFWPDVVRDVSGSERWTAVWDGTAKFEFGKVA